MSEENKQIQEEAEVSYSFGQRLSSARRALNLTQEQVAAELRLKVDLIKALEEEDYSRLPTHMYIAGYLRNYTRLLKIPAEPLLSALNKVNAEAPPLITDVSRPRKASHSRLMVKLFVLVLFVIVVAGIVSWIQSQDFSALLKKSTTETGSVKIIEQQQQVVVDEKPVDEPVVTKSDVVIPADSHEVETEVSPVKPEQPAAIQEVDIQEETVEVVAPRNEPTEAVQSGVELLLTFGADCWTEVKDSRGNTLAYDLYREGQSKQVIGLPPFNIFLGNAATVKIKYNGQAYDASEHISGDLARFSLGQSEDYKGSTE